MNDGLRVLRYTITDHGPPTMVGAIPPKLPPITVTCACMNNHNTGIPPYALTDCTAKCIHFHVLVRTSSRLFCQRPQGLSSRISLSSSVDSSPLSCGGASGSWLSLDLLPGIATGYCHGMGLKMSPLFLV
jgi:hypothetical protein